MFRNRPRSLIALLFLLPFNGFCQTTFTDITDSAGVGDANFGVGAAWGDFNRDGWLDLYLVNLGQANALYLNNHGNTFTDVTSQAGVGDTGDGVGCVWGDYDNDGDLDLFVTNRPGADRLYQNQGDSTFLDRAPDFGISDPTGWGESAAWADYDNDGYLDLYKVRMYQSNVLYRNLNGQGFDNVTTSAGVGNSGPGEGCAWCDYDNDGDLDLYVTNADGYNVLYRNDHNGTFTDVTDSAGIREYGSSYGCAWGDYDNDGDFDLYVGRNGANKLYRNNGNGTFDDASAQAGVISAAWTLGVSWGDFDNDGWQDLHLAVHQGDDILYHNLGDGTFQDVTEQAQVHNYFNARGNIWGDFDHDGFLDLYITNHDGAPNVLFQNNGNTNHFLHISLEGTDSNRDGIGSKAVCVIDSRRMTAQVEGGSGFASQNSPPIEFGLGTHTMVDSIYIYWLSGTLDILTDIQGDQFTHIIEGQSAGANPNLQPTLPAGFTLHQNYPNPFNAATTITYALPNPGAVTLNVCNILSQRLFTLYQGLQSSGTHAMTWNPTGASSGVYFAILYYHGHTQTVKMLYLK